MTSRALRRATADPTDRYQLWARFLRSAEAHTVAEVGVFRGDFAARMLRRLPGVTRYYLIDPWRHLDGWNKPANRDDERFQRFYEETMRRTDFAADRRVVLRGTTVEVSDQIPDGSLDFVYIDGDHTLRGIAVDLLRWYPKVREGGWLGGDDFTPRVWQHGTNYDPTLVFPFAVYFAEAMDVPVHGLPFNQFLVEKTPDRGFSFADTVGRYRSLDLQTLMSAPPPRRRRGYKGAE